MKLLLIMPSDKRGGVEEHGLKIGTAAVQAAWDVHAAFPKTGGMETLIKDLQEAGVSYHPLKIAETTIPSLAEISRRHQALFPILRQLLVPRLKFDTAKIPHFFRTLQLLRRLKPEVVLINLPWADYGLGSILACALLKIPTLVVFHLIPYPLRLGTFKQRLYRWAHGRKQAWIGVSAGNARCISQSFRIPEEKTGWIYNGATIRPETPTDAKAHCLRIRQALGLPSDSTIILTVARLSGQKGHDFLIPAIPHLIKAFPGLKFVWVGEGEKKEELGELLRAYGIADQVLLLGHRSDIPDLLQAADLFVLPTYYEGQPFALLEAMAYGLPLITTNTDGIPEVIQHKVHGLLTRKGDSADLLESIRWALQHPEEMQQMAGEARRRVKDFSGEKMLEQTLNLLKELAG
jgi:glycosyltransferase involved in cell wall biosynthesis